MQVQSKLRREGGTKIEFEGVEYHFTPNEAGDHVAEVNDEAALSRLVNEIPEGYALYGADAGKKVARPQAPTQHAHPLNREKAPKQPDTMVIKNGDGEELDLMTLDLDAARTFAKEVMGIDVHAKWKVETIRTKIVEATRASGE
jgi:hypothetical protein